MSKMHRLLWKLTAKLPRREIRRDDGMPYLDRYYLGQLCGVTAYLHHFHGPDRDEGPHDHPWGWALSWVLNGWYLEHCPRWLDADKGLEERHRTLRRFSLNFLRGWSIHRIVDAKPNTWTLFIHGPRVRSWGFYEQVAHRDTNVDATGKMDFMVFHQPYDVQKTSQWWLTAGTREGRADA